MTEVARVHPPAPLFFLSYARSGGSGSHTPQHELNQQVITFFNDLSENVAGLVSRRPGADPGFMDRTIRIGSQWTGELLQALGTCQVFVALLCGPYTTSQWCGMEWYAFSQRKVADGREYDHQTAIIPAIWAPYPEELTPTAIRAVQRFSPSDLPNVDILGEYEKYGISGLMWMKRDISYRGVVWRLAQHIADFHHSYSVEPRTLRQDELRDTFQENQL